MDASTRLGIAAANTRFAAAPSAVRERVIDLVTDTLAVTAWGQRRPELVRLREVSTSGESTGHATVFGTPIAGPATVAAQLNGAAAAADQWQDGHRLAKGHPASHVVLAVQAVAEELDRPSDAALTAILAGYEVGVRVGLSMSGTPEGVHDIGTWGAVAVAAASAHLLSDGDAAAIARAIDLAAACLLLSDARTIFDGWDGGHVFLGASISHGLWLGQSAAAGLTAAPGALDRFFGAHAARRWDPTALPTDDTWPQYEILHGYLKLHPACAHLHGALDALHGLSVVPSTDIDRIEVETYGPASEFNVVARNGLQARFSLPTALAIAATHDALTDDVLTDAAATDPEIRALAARVHVRHDNDLDTRYPSGRPTTVTVHRRDGTTFQGHSERPRGDDDTTSRALFAAKAERLLDGAFPGQGTRLAESTARLIDGETPRSVGALFREAAANASTPAGTPT